MITLDVILNQILVLLGFISIVLIPFLILLIKDIRKLSHQIEDALADGNLDSEEIDQIMKTVGGIFLRIYVFFGLRHNK